MLWVVFPARFPDRPAISWLNSNTTRVSLFEADGGFLRISVLALANVAAALGDIAGLVPMTVAFANFPASKGFQVSWDEQHNRWD